MLVDIHVCRSTHRFPKQNPNFQQISIHHSDPGVTFSPITRAVLPMVESRNKSYRYVRIAYTERWLLRLGPKEHDDSVFSENWLTHLNGNFKNGYPVLRIAKFVKHPTLEGNKWRAMQRDGLRPILGSICHVWWIAGDPLRKSHVIIYGQSGSNGFKKINQRSGCLCIMPQKTQSLFPSRHSLQNTADVRTLFQLGHCLSAIFPIFVLTDKHSDLRQALAFLDTSANPNLLAICTSPLEGPSAILL